MKKLKYFPAKQKLHCIVPLRALIVTCFLCGSGCGQVHTEHHDLVLASGRIERIPAMESRFIHPRNIDIWLPSSYSPDSSYAVLYMHDGQMLFDSTATWNEQEWGVDETMGRLQQSGLIRPAIVVGIWNTEYRHAEYFPQKPFELLPEAYRDSLRHRHRRPGGTSLFNTDIDSDNYLSFIVNELKPYIDSSYSTLPDPSGTFIAGSSMGGLITLYALCEYPRVFGGAACLSTHWPGSFDTTENPIPEKLAEYFESNLPDPKDHRLYFDYGTETLDSLYEPFQIRMDSILIKRGYSKHNWLTLKFPGADHSEQAWKDRLDIPFIFLLSQNAHQ